MLRKALLLLLSIHLLTAATIHGKVYDADTFDVVEGAIVSINTTPVQKMVAGSDGYLFNVPEGNYTITAEIYDGGKVIKKDSMEIEVKDEGDYVIDLVLFGIGDFDITEIPSVDIVDLEMDEAEVQGGFGWEGLLVLILFFIVLLAIIGILRRRKGMEIDEELRRILRILKDEGGRMTQKELRKRLPFSEAKVSLMLSELESYGYIKKIKRGRGNILILKKEV